MKTCVLIPARYQSSRFPGKPLVDLVGMPMVVRVCNLAAEAVGSENVFVATDDERIAQTVSNSGYKYIMTSSECLTGTDRIAEASKELDYEIIINVQGDEPLVEPNDIKKCAQVKRNHFNEVVCGYTEIGVNEDPKDRNIPKVLVTDSERLIYMSRSPLPGYKSIASIPEIYYKQVCIYGFNKYELEQFRSYSKKARYESYEDIEILRFFELEIPMRMYKTKPGSIAVDVFDDIKKVEDALRAQTG
jgi:3-deoxy-manno-octulosonate cytidylyltransferase (CMP-KDO synthetase)